VDELQVRDRRLSDTTVLPGLFALFCGFLEIAVSGFGGVMPWARRVLVEKRRWLSPDEFTDLLSLCQFLPGPNIVNMSIAVGARFCGGPGAVVAFLGLMGAPVLIVLALGMLYGAYGHVPRVQSVIHGISAVASGLLVATGIKMLVAPRLRSWMLAFGVLMFMAVAIARLPLVLALLALAPLSIAAAWLKLRPGRSAWRDR
jgi:chromate transporter